MTKQKRTDICKCYHIMLSMSSENLNPKISAGSQLRRSTMRQLNVIIKTIILNAYGKDKTDSFK